MTDTVSDSERLSDEVFPYYAVENNSNGGRREDPAIGGCGCSRSLTYSCASRAQSNLGSPSALLMLWRYPKMSADTSDFRR